MFQSLPKQTLVARVEIPRFMGKWYVIANIPTIFEKGAHNATETYTWNEEKQRIDIDFRFNKNSFDGPEKSIPQKGFVYNEETGSEWRVQPIWPLRLGYLIIGLGKGYKDCMVGVPNRKHLWIMSRTPHMEKRRLQALLTQAKSYGYDTSKVQAVPQAGHKSFSEKDLAAYSA
jgi:apolipoprotein D and lipocalin family protein